MFELFNNQCTSGFGSKRVDMTFNNFLFGRVSKYFVTHFFQKTSDIFVCIRYILYNINIIVNDVNDIFKIVTHSRVATSIFIGLPLGA